MKRVALKISSKFKPEHSISGYALVNELNGPMFTFFCTEKFALDEELEIHLHFGGHDLTYKILMSHLHEQISSGRIMNALPTEENPFPARKFYRCFARILELQGMDGVDGMSPQQNEGKVTPLNAEEPSSPAEPQTAQAA